MARTSALTLLLAIACSSPASAPAATGAEADGAGKAATPDVPVDPKLLDVDAANATAPDTYDVLFDTSEGEFVVTVHRDWAPIGADRFYNLVSIGYYDDSAFFRVVQGFMVQFGIHGVPKVSSAWKVARMADDPRKQSNRRGTISFANSGPNTRTTQVFINYNTHTQLDDMHFAPFGEVTRGFEVVQKLHAGYGDGPPNGPGPDQRDIERQGNRYLKKRYPELDWIKTAKIVSK
jgi:peptidyl-prolyl cis-trans isomerase A (cyclophilin A)